MVSMVTWLNYWGDLFPNLSFVGLNMALKEKYTSARPFALSLLYFLSEAGRVRKYFIKSKYIIAIRSFHFKSITSFSKSKRTCS